MGGRFYLKESFMCYPPAIIQETLSKIIDKLLLEAASPAEVKAKLGIKANAVSDDDFEQIMNSGLPRQQWPFFVRYSQQADDMPLVMSYADKLKANNPNANLSSYATFAEFTDALDAMDYQNSKKKAGADFSIENTAPDFQSQDGKYRVYEASGMQDCIKYGRGQTFCISRPTDGNMYSHYRNNQQSKYYFVFNLNKQPDDNTYITVVDAQPDGRFEFTHKNNDTLATSKEYQYSLEKFLEANPGLRGLKSVFKEAPMSDEERAEIEYFKKIYQSNGFSKLSGVQKIRFVESTKYNLPDDDFDRLPPNLKNDYIKLGKVVSGSSIAKMGEALQKVWVKTRIDNEMGITGEDIKGMSVGMQKYVLGTDSFRKLYPAEVKYLKPEVIETAKTLRQIAMCGLKEFKQASPYWQKFYVQHRLVYAHPLAEFPGIPEGVQRVLIDGGNITELPAAVYFKLSPAIKKLALSKHLFKDVDKAHNPDDKAGVESSIVGNHRERSFTLKQYAKMNPEAQRMVVDRELFAPISLTQLIKLPEQWQAYFINHGLIDGKQGMEGLGAMTPELQDKILSLPGAVDHFIDWETFKYLQPKWKKVFIKNHRVVIEPETLAKLPVQSQAFAIEHEMIRGVPSDELEKFTPEIQQLLHRKAFVKKSHGAMDFGF